LTVTLRGMSPVSKGRKPKKNKKAKKAAKVWVPLNAEPEPLPEWMDQAVGHIIDRLDSVMLCTTPSELEQTAAELLGAELKWALDGSKRLDFDLFFDAVVEAIARRPSAASWRLLHGLSAIAPPGVGTSALAAANQVKKKLVVETLPDWPPLAAKTKANGEVWTMQDIYGTRLAVIMGLKPSSVYLVELNQSWIPRLGGGDVYDDVDQAAEAWRKQLGEEAGPPSPVPVTEPVCLQGYAHLVTEAFGDESRSALDNWYRAERRFYELESALRNRGMRIPRFESLYDDIDPTVMTEPFLDWHRRRHGNEPDPEVVEELALVWMEDSVPESWFSTSPERIHHIGELVGDWVDDFKAAAQPLLPTWVRWLGDRSDLPEHLVDRMVAQATK
jgi:hypothetical protein